MWGDALLLEYDVFFQNCPLLILKKTVFALWMRKTRCASRTNPEGIPNLPSCYPLTTPLLSPYYPLTTLLLESTLNLWHEVLILNFFLLSIKFSTFKKKQLSEIHPHSPFKLIGICAAYRNMLVRAEHLQLIAARTSSRNRLDEIHVNYKGAVTCKHTPKAVEQLA